MGKKGTNGKIAKTSTRLLTQFASGDLDVNADDLRVIKRDKVSTNELHKAFLQCKNWYQDIGYLATLIDIQKSFLNYGPSIKSQNQDLQKELQRPVNVYDEVEVPLMDYITILLNDIWTQYLTLSNVVVYWNVNNRNSVPILLSPERCEFIQVKDKAKLRYYPGYTTEEAKLLSSAEQERIKTGSMVIGDVPGEMFCVIKPLLSPGFAWPALMSQEDVCSELLSLYAGQKSLASSCRTVTRQHKIGHKIDTGPYAGSSKNFWKKNRSDEIIKQYKRKGFFESTTNFDHEIVFPVPDAKLFDGTRFESAFHRLELWAGPVGEMVQLRGVNTYLMTLLKSYAVERRKNIAPYINFILNEAFGFSDRVSVSWSNRIFSDTKLASDMVQFYTRQGAMSLETALDEGGYDITVERSRKQLEFKAEQDSPGTFKPVFDAAHGDNEGAGRPKGTKDPNNQE